MRVLLTSEARFERAPDGTIWGPSAYGYALWRRYLDVFSAVLIAARVADVTEVSPGSVRASLPGVEFWPLPTYSGLSGLVRHLQPLRSSVEAAVRMSPAILVRTPSAIAYLTSRAAARVGRPFGAEVVGDADEVFAPGASRHPLRFLIRDVAAATQRRLARDAAAVLYVTSETLQRRYPTAGQAYAASDVALDDLAFTNEARHEWSPPAPFRLVTVAGLDQPYKGTSVLLEAMRELCQKAVPVKLRLVGGGRLMNQFQHQCQALGLSMDVEFVGQLDAAGVRHALDSAHLFVLPSLTEGLPRALLEAMARGLPAVATNVGGVPELLPPECLVPRQDAGALAAKIGQMMADSGARQRLGERNRTHAQKYHERLQAPGRRAFLVAVRDVSAAAAAEVRCA